MGRPSRSTHQVAVIHLTRQSRQGFTLSLPSFELLQGSCILSVGTASKMDSRHGMCSCVYAHVPVRARGLCVRGLCVQGAYVRMRGVCAGARSVLMRVRACAQVHKLACACNFAYMCCVHA
eukprot:1159339-Pelagomonas_calceolata.AAC.9